MAEEVGIVMSLYDKVSPTLKAIAGNSRAFDKTLDDLEASLKAYEASQSKLVTRSAELKKAMAESNLKVQEARQSYRKLKDETSKGALDQAIEEQARLRQELTETEQAIRDQNAAYKVLYKNANAVATAASKADNRAAGDGQQASLVSSLSKAGVTKMLGDSVAQAAGFLAESALGQPTATALSSMISGAATGAALGSVVPGIGTAVGAAAGALSGAISGLSQIQGSRDDAFKSYVQESFEGQISARDAAIESGSAIAGGREQKQLAFATLLGSDEASADFLNDVKAMAAMTNYTYDEITGYAKSLVKPFGADQSLEVLTTLSDASAALSLNESDNAVLIAGLSRMKLTDKTTQEYLNYFSERGIDVYEALSKWGDAAAVAEKVTAGKIKGSEAVEALLTYMQEQYGGLSEKMADTYEGMMGNLEDAEANAQAAYGEGYNAERKEGIRAQMDWLSSGAMDEANKAIGAWQAELDNEKERFVREAVDAMMTTDEYQQAKAEGDAAEMGRLIMQAKVRGMNEYNASEGAQEALAAEKALADAIRSDTATNQDYWDAGYEKGNWFTKGLSAGIMDRTLDLDVNWDVDPDSVMTGNGQGAVTSEIPTNWDVDPSAWPSYAYGLDRVPYDNFPALLHEGERVQTAREAREMDSGGGDIVIHIGGNWTVRSQDDADMLAETILRKIQMARQGGAR